MSRMGVVVGAALAACVLSGAAQAAVLTLTTSGTIDSGTDSSLTFGSSGNLAGRAYSLTLTFAGLGDSTFASPSDISTSGSVPGSALVTIGGRSVAVPILNSYASFIEETTNEIYATNNGDDGAGDIVAATNAYTVTSGAALPVGLGTGFSRTGGAADLPGNTDQVSFSLSGGLGTFSFTGTPGSVQLQVPEPASAGLLAAGLVALGWRRRRRLLVAALPLAALAGTAFPARAQSAGPCDVRAFGAVADGATDNTAAIQSAINACAQAGGGIVRVTGGGTFVSGPISLLSHVHLQIDAGTVLKNTTDHTRYQPAFIGYPFQFQNSSAGGGTGPNLPGKPEAMISAANVVDVGIIGAGTIDGSGADIAADGGPSWWTLANNAKAAQSAPGFVYTDAYNPAPTGYPDIPTSNGLPRPWLVEFYNAQNVVVNGITLTNSPMWNLGLRYVTGAQISGYKVRSPSDSPNTDGIDLVGAQNVTLVGLDIDTGDDNVAIKSGLPGVPSGSYYLPPYNLPRIATSGVTVVNSTFRRGHGLSVGSETFNGVNTIRAMNITFLGTDNGFRIKTGRDRGNQIYGITLSGLTMTDVPTPLSLSDYYPTVPTASQGDITQTTTAEPYVHDISVTNLTATNPGTVRATTTTGGLILGLPESPIYNLVLNHVHISAAKPTTIRVRNLTNSQCTDVTVTPNTGSAFTVDPGAPGSVGSAPGCGM